jgi:hypothetical protein
MKLFPPVLKHLTDPVNSRTLLADCGQNAMGVKSAVIKEAGRPGAALLVPGRGTSASSQLQAATPFASRGRRDLRSQSAPKSWMLTTYLFEQRCTKFGQLQSCNEIRGVLFASNLVHFGHISGRFCVEQQGARRKRFLIAFGKSAEGNLFLWDLRSRFKLRRKIDRRGGKRKQCQSGGGRRSVCALAVWAS